MQNDEKWDAAIAALIDDDPDLAVLLIRKQQEEIEFNRFIEILNRRISFKSESLRYVEHPD